MKHETQAVRGRIVTPDGVIDDGVVDVSGERITGVRVADTPHETLQFLGTIVPGFIDLHCHGGGGSSFSSAELDELAAAAKHHLARGTTTVLAAMVTDDPARMLEAIEVAADATDLDLIAGIYVEGPFLSAVRCGAQDPAHLRRPDIGLAREFLRAGRGHVRAMTLAPELPGASDLVDMLLEEGVVAAIGHTACEAAEAQDVLRRGHAAGVGALATHLFNGMPPLHHRSPGPVGAALMAASAGRARVELIVDGVHLDDLTVRMVLSMLGTGSVVLVSDAMAAAGMPDGTYRLGSQDVRVDDGIARLVVDGAAVSIAGSTTHLADAVRRCVREVGVSLTTAVAAATTAPAAALGATGQIGSLSAGSRADLVVLDGDTRLRGVMRRGRWLK